MSTTQTTFSQLETRQSFSLEHERKKMIDAWISFIIVSIVMSLIFPYEPFWVIIIRIVMFIHAIRLSIDYSHAKKSMGSSLISKTPQEIRYSQKYISYEPVSYYTPTVVESKIQTDSAKYCSMCGQKHEQQAQFCSSCGTKLL